MSNLNGCRACNGYSRYPGRSVVNAGDGVRAYEERSAESDRMAHSEVTAPKVPVTPKLTNKTVVSIPIDTTVLSVRRGKTVTPKNSRLRTLTIGVSHACLSFDGDCKSCL